MEVDGSSRVQVVVRCRPVLPHEKVDDVAVTCSEDASRVQVLLPDRLAAGANSIPGSLRCGARSYAFDACLNGSTTQSDLFETCGMGELVDSALDGFSVTIFAFGQTGSGKTHSMIGPRLSRSNPPGGAAAAPAGADGTPATMAAVTAAGVDEEDGVLVRCLAHAYESIAARKGTADFTTTATCVELYNESVTDLLGSDKSKTLQVRQDKAEGFQVVDLTQASCNSCPTALRYMHKALTHRHTRSHKLNEYSSRSHCLITFHFASKETGDDQPQGAKGGVRRYGKLTLVDLAGSERLKDTGNTAREAVRETGSINKSLFNLGQVLSALCAKSGGASVHVPYRDSKLTQLLWDGLRGTGRALMLGCLGPLKQHAEETLNTLHFAGMAQRIKSRPVVLLDPQDQLVLDLRRTIDALRTENRQLSGALQQLSSGADIPSVLRELPEGALRIDSPATDDAGADGVGGVRAASPPQTSPSASSLRSAGASSTGKPSWTVRNGVQSSPSTPAGRSMVEQMRPADYADMSMEQMQAEYVRQRAYVVEELRRAKEDAEHQRRAIITKINRTVNRTSVVGSRWRNTS